MTYFDNIKPLALALLIGVGAFLHHSPAHSAELQTLTVAGGCFWCVEADFEDVPGVVEAVSGFTGGTVANPTYKQVTRGGTGHFEAVQIKFDPQIVSRATLLNMFMRSIDPTDANGQFCDRGDSYRTAIFVSDPDERLLAETAIQQAQAVLNQPIVTPVLPSGAFYQADASHQDYYEGSNLVLTRRGPKSQASAYKFYRKACGRDARVRQLWGDDAPFAGS